MLEWIQSIPGIITMGMGTLGVGGMITGVFAVINGAKKTKGVDEMVGVINDAKETIVEKNVIIAQKDVELINKDAELLQKNAEIAEYQDVQALLLRSMSSVVAASGIDAVTKLSLVNDLEAAKTRSIERSKVASELITQKKLEAEELLMAKTKMTVEEYNQFLRDKIGKAGVKTEEAKATAEQKILDAKNKAIEEGQKAIALGAENGSKFLTGALDALNKASEKYTKK